MTVAELRALLGTLPERFDDTEVMVSSPRGLSHARIVQLDRTRLRADQWPDITRPESRERKLRITAGFGWIGATLWTEEAPEWRLEGWWPPEAADIGLPEAR